MSDISRIVKKNAEPKKIKLMTHVVVGYPSLDETFALIMEMVHCGVDCIELQIPFSDPVADGPTILKASQKALENGIHTKNAFELVARARTAGVEIPLLCMTYANIVLAQGIENFVEQATLAGFDGFIIPDLPLDTEEGKLFFESCQKYGSEMIPLFAPTMHQNRYELLSKYSQNLVYAVSRTGITGVEGVSQDLDSYLATIKQHTNAHIALGFGIQSFEQIEALIGKVEYAVMGSHILRIFEQKGISGVSHFLKKKSLD